METAEILDRVGLTPETLRDYCDRWKITKFELFGSILRDDFHADSDLDCLVTFATDASINLFDLVTMQDELADHIERPVDLIMRDSMEDCPNPITRSEILNTAQPIFVMHQSDRDHASMLDVLRISQNAYDIGKAMTVDELRTDIIRQSAILYQLTILGEAVKRLSQDFRDRYPDIPWKAMAGMRDILTHQYNRVKVDVVHDVLQGQLPNLIPKLEKIVDELG